MFSIGIVFTILFISLGSILLRGKGIRMLSVYNMLPKSRKATICKEALCQFMGKIFFGFAFGSMLWIIGGAINSSTVIVLGLIIIASLAIASTIYVLTTKHFNNNK